VSPPETPLSPDLADQAKWFAENLHPHRGPLRAYVRSAFPTLQEVDDVVQESYLRVIKAHAVHPIRFCKAFLFTTARNVAINLLQRQRINPLMPVADLASLAVLDEKADVSEATCTKEEIALLADGIDALPARCREVFVLRRIKGVSQAEIAAQLGISEQTVQAQVQRGVKACAEFLRRRGVRRESTVRMDRPVS